MTTFTATYSPDDNKLRLYASSRLDAETYARVKAAGFKWAPKQELFVAPMWTPAREDLCIELAGQVDDEDTSLVDRAEQRAERFEDYSDKREADAMSARAAVDRIADGIPMGQPILVGHHSERHARKDAERIQNGMRKAVKMWETSKYWTARAAGAIQHAKYKELPRVRANRIKTIEADKRRLERTIAESAAKLRLWSTEGLTLEQARRIANTAANPGVCKQEGRGPYDYWTAYDVLQPDGERYAACPSWTVEQVQEAAKRAYTAGAEHRARWMAHYDNRLAYEKAMLAEQGASELLAPKPRPTHPPLLNYKPAAGYIESENIYHRGEVLRYQIVEATKEQYAKLPNDYRGGRLSLDKSHRFRIGMGFYFDRARFKSHEYVAVFLTDSKDHGEPKPVAPAEAPHPAALIPDRTLFQGYTAPATKTDPRDAEFKALAAAAQAGVTVVAVPQLFPTPPDLAARVVSYAGIEAGQRILEPSAGSGQLLGAVLHDGPPVEAVAIEINARAVEVLRTQQAAGAYPGARIECRDFLECNGDLGTFDRIVMNPPFNRGADIQHIEHALTMLKPGGRLVAICANGPRQREKLQAVAIHWEDLPTGTFKDVGTMVNTALVVIDKGTA